MPNKAPKSSVAALSAAVKALGPMAEEVVFIGGSVLGFLITDPAAPPIRTTEDVDLIVNAITYGDFREVDERLLKLGFSNDATRNTCSYKLKELLLDILPSDPSALGMKGYWTKAVLGNFARFKLESGTDIKIVTPPYFLALKLEAFRDRGNHDFYAHKDMQDIIALLDGRRELADEVRRSTVELKTYVKQEFLSMKEELLNCVHAHIGDGAGEKMRIPMVHARIEELSSL